MSLSAATRLNLRGLRTHPWGTGRMVGGGHLAGSGWAWAAIRLRPNGHSVWNLPGRPWLLGPRREIGLISLAASSSIRDTRVRCRPEGSEISPAEGMRLHVGKLCGSHGILAVAYRKWFILCPFWIFFFCPDNNSL